MGPYMCRVHDVVSVGRGTFPFFTWGHSLHSEQLAAKSSTGGVQVGVQGPALGPLADRGVTRGGRGGPPLESPGEILEENDGRKKRRERNKEQEREQRGKEKREKGKWRGKRRENCGGKLKIEGGKEVWSGGLFFLTKINLFWGGIFWPRQPLTVHLVTPLLAEVGGGAPRSSWVLALLKKVHARKPVSEGEIHTIIPSLSGLSLILSSLSFFFFFILFIYLFFFYF